MEMNSKTLQINGTGGLDNEIKTQKNPTRQSFPDGERIISIKTSPASVIFGGDLSCDSISEVSIGELAISGHNSLAPPGRCQLPRKHVSKSTTSLAFAGSVLTCYPRWKCRSAYQYNSDEEGELDRSSAHADCEHTSVGKDSEDWELLSDLDILDPDWCNSEMSGAGNGGGHGRSLPRSASSSGLTTVNKVQKKEVTSTKVSSCSAVSQAPSVDWAVIQRAVLSVINGNPLKDGELADLNCRLRQLVQSRVGPLLYDSLRRQTLPRTMSILKKPLMALEGRELLNEIAATWQTFYSQSLTTLLAILIPIKARQLNLRQTILVAFRDGVVLAVETKLGHALDTCHSHSAMKTVKQMLLVLQNIADSYPPAEPRLRLETLTARVVKPFIGFKGLYDGSSIPYIKSNMSEADILAKRRSSSTIEQRRLLRPLSVQTGCVENLTDLFVRSVGRQKKANLKV